MNTIFKRNNKLLPIRRNRYDDTINSNITRTLIKLCPYCNIPFNKNTLTCRNCHKDPITFFKMTKRINKNKFGNYE